MSTVNYTEIIFKIKEEYIKHTRVNYTVVKHL